MSSCPPSDHNFLFENFGLLTLALLAPAWKYAPLQSSLLKRHIFWPIIKLCLFLCLVQL